MIVIYAESDTARLRYTLDFIFNEFLGTGYSITSSLPDNPEYPFINYSGKKTNGINICPGGLLYHEIPETQQLNAVWDNKIPLIFPDNNSDTGHDTFSSVFYFLSRYEEYDSYIPDTHGRFPATLSMAHQQGFLQIPVVDLWLIRLKNTLKNKYPELKFKERKFEYHSTIDVDNAFKYKGKNFLRQLAGAGRDILSGKINNLSERVNFLLGKINDPFEAYDFQMETSKKFQTDLHYFILFTYPGKHDHSLFPDNKIFSELIDKLSRRTKVGIHPCYASVDRFERLQEDIKGLSKVCGKKTISSRQHFLRFRLPITLQQLETLGIQEEYSMGYSTHNGFRAGTATPFFFYDLMQEKTTKIKIFPFQIMDSVFYDQQKTESGESLAEIEHIVNAVKEVKGQLYTVWHDRSFDEKEFPGWRDVYLRIHQLCSA